MAPIDKLSVVFVVIFALLFLGEKLTWKVGLGSVLVARAPCSWRFDVSISGDTRRSHAPDPSAHGSSRLGSHCFETAWFTVTYFESLM